MFPPSLGGRTVKDMPSFSIRSNPHKSHIWEYPSRPRKASGEEYSGRKTISAFVFARPLWRGIPNFSLKSQLMRPIGSMFMGFFRYFLSCQLGVGLLLGLGKGRCRHAAGTVPRRDHAGYIGIIFLFKFSFQRTHSFENMLSEKHAFYSEAGFFFPNTAFSSNEAFFSDAVYLFEDRFFLGYGFSSKGMFLQSSSLIPP